MMCNKKIVSMMLAFAMLASPLPVHAKEQENTAADKTPAALLQLPEPIALPGSGMVSAQEYTKAQEYDEIQLYRQLEQKVKEALLAGKKSIDISDMNISAADYNLAGLQCFSPYFSNGIKLESYCYENTGRYASIGISNSMSVEETKDYFEQVDARVTEILQVVPDDLSEEQKVLKLHDYFACEFAYDQENLENGTLPDDSYRSGGLFMKEVGVCQAYAYGFQYILSQIGMECYVAASGVMEHAWNIVKVDDHYYHMDVTWDDPVYDRLGRVTHEYFLLSDEAIQNEEERDVHIGWDHTDLVCDSKKYDHAYWQEAVSAVVVKEDTSYYMKNDGLYKKDKGSQEELIKDVGIWHVWGQNSYWTGTFSGLFLYNDNLYYNTETEIRKISLDGTTDVLVCKPEEDILAQGYIYGSRRRGNQIEYVIMSSPNEQSGTIFRTDFDSDEPTPPADKTALKKAIQDAVPETDKDKYTENSWALYAEALAKAKEAESDVDATQADVDAAIAALKAAADALEEVTEPPMPKRPFEDVDEAAGDWYYNAVYYNFDRGIMNGVNETHFEPMSKLARAQFAIILHNMEDKPVVSYEAKFKDVEAGKWYTSAILWASSKEIVTGYTDGSETFGWGDRILREQMAVMMYRYAKNFKKYDVSVSADYSKFADAAQVDGYAGEAMAWATGTGIITGKDLDRDGTPESIDPLGDASRAECAIIIQRFLEKYEK